MVYAYVRVSTQHQILDNQIEEISSFAARKNLCINKFVEESVSGTKKSKDRKLGTLINKMKPSDVLIVSEISRLSRTMTEIMSIMGILLEKKVVFYSIKENFSFEDSINSKVLCFAFGISAEIERSLISMRTKEALALRKKNGVRLGRPCGSGKLTGLSAAQKEELVQAVQNGDKGYITATCRKYQISKTTYYKIKRNGHI